MGNAYLSAAIWSRLAVHPHVHGERKLLPTEGLIRVGSSPRAWGTRRAVRKHPEHVRFIPTCMGNASARMHRVCSSTVHPHVHGERVKSERDTERFFGSSPRAWGTPNTPKSTSPGRRFIPTCMGNAFRWNLRSESPAVHPHVHGERAAFATCSGTPPGSSPRAWGTLNQNEWVCPKGRFIPTCMGNAPLLRPVPVLHPVHPHVHGERSRVFIARVNPSGSSPRAWGTLNQNEWVCPKGRFIPTCMGNAAVGVEWVPVEAVHPHVHGERINREMIVKWENGSSPRAWGTRFLPTR